MSISIQIFGVCHTAATVKETMQHLAAHKFSSASTVFIEPKKRILEGSERCDDPNIMRFFRTVLDFLFSHDAKIIPLNPSFTPSHNSSLLYRKIAQQFAEEEYMVDVIAEECRAGPDRDFVVVIGDIHAPRMRDLLKAKGFKTAYTRVSDPTPSDELVSSWRHALLGKARWFISMNWLKDIRKGLRRKMDLPDTADIPMIFYGDEELYHRYLREAHGMEVKSSPDKKKYIVPCQTNLVKEAKDAKWSALRQIRSTRRASDHEPVKKNLIR